MQRAYRYGTVGSFMIRGVFLDVYWLTCSLICLSVGGYGTTDIKLLNFMDYAGCVRLFVCVYVLV